MLMKDLHTQKKIGSNFCVPPLNASKNFTNISLKKKTKKQKKTLGLYFFVYSVWN